MGLFLRILPFVLIALLVVIPTRRLYLAGWPRSFLLSYFVIVVGLGAIVAELDVAARYLVPILVVAYIAPFVTAGAGIARLLGRSTSGGPASGSGPVVRRVTPTILPPTTGSDRGRTRDEGVDADEDAGGMERPGDPPDSDSMPPGSH